MSETGAMDRSGSKGTALQAVRKDTVRTLVKDVRQQAADGIHFAPFDPFAMTRAQFVPTQLQ